MILMCQNFDISVCFDVFTYWQVENSLPVTKNLRYNCYRGHWSDTKNNLSYHVDIDDALYVYKNCLRYTESYEVTLLW